MKTMTNGKNKGSENILSSTNVWFFNKIKLYHMVLEIFTGVYFEIGIFIILLFSGKHCLVYKMSQKVYKNSIYMIM